MEDKNSISCQARSHLRDLPYKVIERSDGLKLYVDPGDQRAKLLIDRRGDLNPTTLSMWRELCTAGNWTHVIDVGANYGEMTVEVPGARYLVVEPNPHLLPYLRATVADSGLDIEVVNAAISDQAGALTLNTDRTWSGLSTAMPHHAEWEDHTIEKIDVASVTLASLVHERLNGPPRLLCKIDVEGYETAVLRGLENALLDLSDFAALVELTHLSSGDLDWMLSVFEMLLRRLSSGRLESTRAKTAQELKFALSSGDFYKQDVVLKKAPLPGE